MTVIPPAAAVCGMEIEVELLADALRESEPDADAEPEAEAEAETEDDILGGKGLEGAIELIVVDRVLAWACLLGGLGDPAIKGPLMSSESLWDREY